MKFGRYVVFMYRNLIKIWDWPFFGIFDLLVTFGCFSTNRYKIWYVGIIHFYKFDHLCKLTSDLFWPPGDLYCFLPNWCEIWYVGIVFVYKFDRMWNRILFTFVDLFVIIVEFLVTFVFFGTLLWNLSNPEGMW